MYDNGIASERLDLLVTTSFQVGVQRINGRKKACEMPEAHLQIFRHSLCKGHSDTIHCGHKFDTQTPRGAVGENKAEGWRMH